MYEASNFAISGPKGEFPKPASRLVQFAHQLVLQSGERYFASEMEVGEQLYSRSQLQRKRLYSVVLSNFDTYHEQLLPYVVDTWDRSRLIPDAINLSGYLIGVAQTLYKPEEDQAVFSRQVGEFLDSHNPSEVNVSKLMIFHIENEAGIIPVASDLGQTVSLDDLVSAMQIVIPDARKQAIYMQTLRFIYSQLLNNPPFDKPTDEDGPQQPPRGGRGGGGGGGRRGPHRPRHPQHDCGCGSYTPWTHDDEQELSRHMQRKSRPAAPKIPAEPARR